MNARFRYVTRLIGAVLLTTRLIAQRPAATPAIAGCYRVLLGQWSRDLGVNAAYHVVPTLIRLDTTVAARGGRVVTPNIAFPRASSFPGTPRWVVTADSVEILWSSGYQTTTLRLDISAPDSLRGIATVGSDANEFGADVPRAAVVAHRVSCPARP
jgi:hypothetical protein